MTPAGDSVPLLQFADAVEQACSIPVTKCRSFVAAGAGHPREGRRTCTYGLAADLRVRRCRQESLLGLSAGSGSLATSSRTNETVNRAYVYGFATGRLEHFLFT